MNATLLQLAALFSRLSLLAFGGGNAVIPAMQRATVDIHHWLTARQFLEVFAISRAAPGPASLIVVLIGQKAAGLAGGLVAALAMFGPSCLLVHIAARFWRRTAEAASRADVEAALAPVAVGLVFASGLAVAEGTEHRLLAWSCTAAATLVMAATEINPLLVLGACAAAALIGGA